MNIQELKIKSSEQLITQAEELGIENASTLRKLLLHKKEIFSIGDAVSKKGETCVLTKLYWKNNKVKCDIAIGKGKKKFDQREDIKKRDWERQKSRILKNSNKS